MDKLSYLVTRYGKEKSRFSVIDRSGVEFHCGNVAYDGKLFFVVSANGKTVECLEIDGFGECVGGYKICKQVTTEEIENAKAFIESIYGKPKIE